MQPGQHPSSSVVRFPNSALATRPQFAWSRSAFSIIVGPCSIESHETFEHVARSARTLGLTALRGGIFKARTKVSSFQGLGPQGYEIARRVSRESGLPLISEITDPRQIDSLAPVVDVFQVGARNMHNTELLKELGRLPHPVLLKRGLSAYLDELVDAAEYVIAGGNSKIAFCERGIRTFERAMRNTLDLAAVPYLQQKTGFPVIVDPSHGTGIPSIIAPMVWAAAACGADGVLLEVHPNPKKALSDGDQALTPNDLEGLMPRLHRILEAVGKPVHQIPPIQ
jgi:3-deoxy-7-phosphoheptulonate synthase